jgi:uncharacterized membrane protein
MKKPWSLKRWFLQGLVLALPIFVTVVVFYYSIMYTDAILWFLWDLLPWDLLPWEVAKPTFPGLGLLVVVTLVIAIGAATESFVVGKAVDLFNWFMSKVPFVRNIYSTVLQVAQSTLGSKDTFTKAVMIEYPRKGIYSIAFKTSDNKEISEKLGREFINVFLPTTPNPTSGFYLIVPKDEAIETDIDPDLAFKLIISAGIVSK